MEAPIGEFFGLGHGVYYTYESEPLSVANDSALNCFFPMPFRKGAKITVENVGDRDVGACYYYIDYQIPNEPTKDCLYFHAQYRQEKPVLSSGNYTILDAAGRGHYVGCFMYVRQNHGGWFGEGDDMIYIDGARAPTLHGTGTEDYFCHAWGFAKQASTASYGIPFSENQSTQGGLYSIYRFHLADAIAFSKSIRVTMEHGHANSRSDDFSSVAYWYQNEPHKPFPALASLMDRRASSLRAQQLLDNKKFDDYRKMQTEIRDRCKSADLKDIAEVNIVMADIAEKGKDKALRNLLDYIGPFPPKDLSETIATAIKQLGGDPTAFGRGDVYLVRGISDGVAASALMEGAPCSRTDRANGSPFIYFDVDNGILNDGDKPVQVEVEYYDTGKAGDAFLIEYDSAFGPGEAEKYRKCEPFTKPGKKGWNTAVLYLDRARFAGRQNNDSDFRITCAGDGDEYIRKVKVTLGKTKN